ncbi:antiviral RADAR system adenosine triphosphatase RdrA [Pseudomonas urmiensis]|uniref:antiviral RADAR system adenosine triphosphatase RdrA n=1 Tax=Pseudomonas urmiensis TaxID=2745493 RepID=UPI0034D44433
MTANAPLPIRFPIEQKEQASQKDTTSLLPRNIYNDLALLLKESLDTQPGRDDDLNRNRSHSAILIDGKRGTGKSSVLVNLGLYLQDEHPTLAPSIHILNPVDPTLLEDTDDLFLNVIVAAIIRDNTIADALSRADHKAEAFHHQLQILGSTLEALQLQRDKFGLDKLRAFMGSHDLNHQVHELFKKALNMIDKQLLVLPIDDVDTSLDRAFENLEVVRRYLTSPYVQPIISGDLKLYHEVTWRDFYSKLTRNSKILTKSSADTAKELATEYQRKIMPLQMRREMPTVKSYLENKNILLCKGANDFFSLHTFWRWIDALLNERTNNLQYRRLELNIENIRELSQLIFTLKDQIPKLHRILEQSEFSTTDGYTLHRLMFMPIPTAQLMETFSSDLQNAQSLNTKAQREAARKRTYSRFTNNAIRNQQVSFEFQSLALETKRALMRHFHHEHSDSAVYLALAGDIHFSELKTTATKKLSTLFKSPIFEPTELSEQCAKSFPGSLPRRKFSDIRDYAPEYWLNSIAKDYEYPYTYPEIGSATRTHSSPELDDDTNLILELMLHRSFYSSNKQSNIIYCGRLFELIIASLVRDIEPNDILSILNRPPFYSLTAMANPNDHVTDRETQESDHSNAIVKLATQINNWRQTERIHEQYLSSWLTFNVLNYFFQQSGYFNSPVRNPTSESPHQVLEVALRAFRSLWNGFARLEKGETFGMAHIISAASIGEGEVFENNDLYRQNISPFLNKIGETPFGLATRSFTHAISSHPIRHLIEKCHSHSEDIISEEHNNLLNLRVINSVIRRHFSIKGRVSTAIKNLLITQEDVDTIRATLYEHGLTESELIESSLFSQLLESAEN